MNIKFMITVTIDVKDTEDAINTLEYMVDDYDLKKVKIDIENGKDQVSIKT